jgi:hypothetical protein
VFVPESLPAERRHGGDLRQFISLSGIMMMA